MFDKHQQIDQISFEYATEKIELQEANKALADIEAEREIIIEEQRKLEEAERNEKLDVIRFNIAAKAIQRAYRTYKAKLLLKKKKRRKKTAQ